MSDYTMQIGGRTVGGKEPTFVIAEIGNNHNGSQERALEMVDMAAEMGAHCAKFQMRHIKEVYRKKSLGRKGANDGAFPIFLVLLKFKFESGLP